MGAFDNYKSPGQDAQTGDTSGAFSGYKPPQPAAAAAPSVPLFSFGGTGNDKIGEFLAKAGDTATFGLGAKLQDALGIGQKDGQTVAQQVEAGGKDIGPVVSAGADVLGYAAGPGMAGVGTGLAKLAGAQLARGVGENVASRVGGRMIGSGIEGTGATILGAAGHDQDLTPGELLKSAALSTATGALPGGAGERPTTPSTADLQSTASGLFTPLKGKSYNASDVGNVMDRITSGMSAGDAVSMGPKLADMRDLISREISNRGAVSADDIAKFQRELRAATGGNDTRQFIANQYANALDKGVGPKTAADIAAANRASNIAKTSSDIEGWAAAPSGAPSAVKSALENSPNFYQTQPGLFDALNKVGARANPPSLGQKVGSYLLDAGIRSGIGAGSSYLMGRNPLEGAVGGVISKVVAPHVMDRAFRAGPISNELLAAQHLNATGMKVDPSVYTSGALQIPGMLARQTGYGLGASGAF